MCRLNSIGCIEFWFRNNVHSVCCCCCSVRANVSCVCLYVYFVWSLCALLFVGCLFVGSSHRVSLDTRLQRRRDHTQFALRCKVRSNGVHQNANKRATHNTHSITHRPRATVPYGACRTPFAGCSARLMLLLLL